MLAKCCSISHATAACVRTLFSIRNLHFTFFQKIIRIGRGHGTLYRDAQTRVTIVCVLWFGGNFAVMKIQLSVIDKP